MIAVGRPSAAQLKAVSQPYLDKLMNSKDFRGVKCSASVIRSSILSLSYRGIYPYGSKGNEIARFMSNYTLEAYRQYLPKAILFDLSDLDYEWGDAICGLVQVIIRERHELSLSIPTCVLAQGGTYESLKPLFESGFLFTYTGTELIAKRDVAISYLLDSLDELDRAG